MRIQTLIRKVTFLKTDDWRYGALGVIASVWRGDVMGRPAIDRRVSKKIEISCHFANFIIM